MSNTAKSLPTPAMPVSPKLLVLLACWAIAFLPIIPEMVTAWLNNNNNSHGLLVPLISLFLIYKRKDELRNIPRASLKIGGLILAVSLTIYIVAFLGAVAVVSRLMMVTSLIGLILYVFGDKVFRQIRFPVLLLFFMVPVPESIYSLAAFPLQLFATKVSTALVQAMGIPAYREGNIVYFLHAQLEVAEACSGLRSMMAFLTLSVLLAHALTNRGRIRAAILVLSTVPLAIGVNIIRVTGTGILAHIYGDKVAQGFLHEFSGLFVFILGFILLACEFFLLNKVNRVN